MKKILFLLSFMFVSVAMATDYSAKIALPYIPPGAWGGAPTLGTLTLDATSESLSLVVQYNSTQPIVTPGFFMGTITVGGTLTYRVETAPNWDIASTTLYEPSGTLVCANSSGTVVVGNAQDDRIIFGSDLPTPCTPTYGNVVNFILTHGGDSFNGVINKTISDFSTDFNMTGSSITAGSRFFTKTVGPPNFILRSGPTDYINLNNVTPYGLAVTTSNAIRNHWVGAVFAYPFNYTVGAVNIWSDMDGGLVMKGLKNNLEMFSVTASSSQRVAANVTNLYFPFPPVDIKSTDTFRIVFSSAIAAASNFYLETAPNESIYTQLYPDGQYTYYTRAINKTPTVEADWTNYRTTRFFMQIIVDKISVSGGGQTSTSFIGP